MSKQQRGAAHARASECSLGPGVTAANDNNIKFFSILHDYFRRQAKLESYRNARQK